MKTFALSLSLAVAFTGLVSALPAQAATRYVEFSLDTFAERCDRQGGIFAADGNYALCQTTTVPVECAFAVNIAQCRWPGIDGQIAVNRVIGLPSANSISATGGGAAHFGGGQGGGFNGPGDFVNPGNDGPKWQGPKDFQANF